MATCKLIRVAHISMYIYLSGFAKRCRQEFFPTFSFEDCLPYYFSLLWYFDYSNPLTATADIKSYVYNAVYIYWNRKSVPLNSCYTEPQWIDSLPADRCHLFTKSKTIRFTVFCSKAQQCAGAQLFHFFLTLKSLFYAPRWLFTICNIIGDELLLNFGAKFQR